MNNNVYFLLATSFLGKDTLSGAFKSLLAALRLKMMIGYLPYANGNMRQDYSDVFFRDISITVKIISLW